MNKTLLAVVIVVILAAAAYVVLQPSQTNAPSTNTATTATPSPSATVSPSGTATNSTADLKAGAVMTNFAFSPAKLTIKTGTTVTWTNQDTVSHTVTSDSGPTSFASSTIGSGNTFSFTFTKPGTYTYHCSIHTSMTGTVEVSD